METSHAITHAPRASDPFAPESPHISVALIMSGAFGQFADPLDWIARGFGTEIKVNRQALSESLAYRRSVSPMPSAEARGTDNRTVFRINLVGRFEGRLIAQCRMTFGLHQFSAEQIENLAVDMTVLNPMYVMGVQATQGKGVQKLAGQAQEKENTFIRLMPINVFGKTYFSDKLLYIAKDKHLKSEDLGDVVSVHLAKPWLFYDMPIPKRKLKAPPPKFLPMWRGE